MPKVKKLYRLDQLRNTGYGQPPPRHGLNLLYWFVTQCVTFDQYGRIFRKIDPNEWASGFHTFQNRPDNNGLKLLPDDNMSYYIVGNLNDVGATSLPNYVRSYKPCPYDRSNMDRIIVNHTFEMVYVTEHADHKNFSSYATYRLSKSLLRKISQMSREEFLKAMKANAEESEDEEDRQNILDSAPLLQRDKSDHVVIEMMGLNEVRQNRQESPNNRAIRNKGTVRDPGCCDCCTIL